jgi:hypothetical protein
MPRTHGYSLSAIGKRRVALCKSADRRSLIHQEWTTKAKTQDAP